MGKVLMILMLILNCFFLKGQPAKYVLDVLLENHQKLENPSFLIIHTQERTFSMTETPTARLILDTSLSYPQPISVYYYTDCTPNEIADLKKYGGIKKPHLTLDFFIIEGVNFIKINSDTILLLQPDLVQENYQRLRNEINERIKSFDLETGNALFEAFKSTQNQRAADSIEYIKDILFKTNVARVNLDSSLMPVIKSNINNALSLYATYEYLRVANILDLRIPKTKLRKLMNAMPPKEMSYAIWKQLYKKIDAIPTTKTLVGNSAPEFIELKDTLGNKVYLRDFKGKVVFLDFWASWCAPCKKQLPQLKNIYEKVKGEKVEFIGISLDFNSSNWKNAIQTSELGWVNLSDLKSNDGITAIKYNVTLIPHNILIDEKGIVIAENIMLNDLETKIKNLVKNVLNK